MTAYKLNTPFVSRPVLKTRNISSSIYEMINNMQVSVVLICLLLSITFLCQFTSSSIVLVTAALTTDVYVVGKKQQLPVTQNTSDLESSMIPDSPYVIIIDGGSTGSRLHIFEFVENGEVVRHGSARAEIPLSAFGPTKDHPFVDPIVVAEHLMPAFRFAAKQIPKQFHATTSVQYQATAGMRLLDEWQQEAVYDSMYDGLIKNPDFVFTNLQRSDIQTLSGELEGYYGAVAANYLHGTCKADLTMLDEDDHPIGALDMGGSSTQIVFLPKQQKGKQKQNQSKSPQSNQGVNDHEPSSPATAESHECSLVDTYGDSETQTCKAPWGDDKDEPDKLLLNENGDFFSTSYLSYGVDQFRERLWTTWVSEHEEQFRKQQQQQSDDGNCDAKLIENPCSFPGYTLEWRGYTFIGTGNVTACVQSVRRLIPHPERPISHHNNTQQSTVGGVAHPSVEGQRFVAMSLYFFTLDSLRELSGLESLNESWPNPSIQELVDALPGLCTRSWHDDLVKIQHNAHKFTRAEVLPHRCMESVYMVTLLRDGFGFAPESRSITFLFETQDGNEVEWTLGMALAVRAASLGEQTEKKLDDSNVLVQDTDTEKQLVQRATNKTSADIDDDGQERFGQGFPHGIDDESSARNKKDPAYQLLLVGFTESYQITFPRIGISSRTQRYLKNAYDRLLR